MWWFMSTDFGAGSPELNPAQPLSRWMTVGTVATLLVCKIRVTTIFTLQGCCNDKGVMHVKYLE